MQPNSFSSKSKFQSFWNALLRLHHFDTWNFSMKNLEAKGRAHKKAGKQSFEDSYYARSPGKLFEACLETNLVSHKNVKPNGENLFPWQCPIKRNINSILRKATRRRGGKKSVKWWWPYVGSNTPLLFAASLANKAYRLFAASTWG